MPEQKTAIEIVKECAKLTEAKARVAKIMAEQPWLKVDKAKRTYGRRCWRRAKRDGAKP